MDITQINTQEDDLFLCVVVNLFSKRVIGWAMPHRQDRQMVLRAVEMAIWSRRGDHEVILHSDGGCQFTRDDYQRFLSKHLLVSSMSAVGHCCDNAACEIFFGLLKWERLHRREYRMLDEVQSDVFGHIERFHNPCMRQRLAIRI